MSGAKVTKPKLGLKNTSDFMTNIIKEAPIGGQLTTLTATLPPGDPLSVKATLSKNGTMELQLSDDAPAPTTKAAPMLETPGDALWIGYDINDAVGNYKAPFRFSGTLGKVTINVVP